MRLIPRLQDLPLRRPAGLPRSFPILFLLLSWNLLEAFRQRFPTARGACWFLLEKTIFNGALIVLCLVFYAVGMFFATHPFDELIGTSFLSFTMIAYSLAAIIVWFCGSYFGMACDLVLLIICFLTFTLLYAIINNQANIERLMGRRKSAADKWTPEGAMKSAG